MDKQSRIYIAGHLGLVGSAIYRKLKTEGFRNLIVRNHRDLDLERQNEVETFFHLEKPEYIFLAAAKVGGIYANNVYPAEFIYRNMEIQTNIIHSAWQTGAKKLLFLGSSCIYPRDCPQPIQEPYLLTGPLEKTNEAYAIAKISGIKMCQSYNRQYGTDFISLMPTNLYGPNDNFHPQTSHVLAALMRKFHEAKIAGSEEVLVWGTGNPRREFLHVDDLADACLFLMNNYSDNEIINIGIGEDLTIGELAELMARIIKFEGRIIFDRSKPDGTPRKVLDVTKLLHLGWNAKISLEEGIKRTYGYYKKHIAKYEQYPRFSSLENRNRSRAVKTVPNTTAL